MRLQPGWNAGKEELVDWREKQEKEGNPSIRLIPELWGVSRGVPPCPQAVTGTLSWGQVSVTAELIIPLEGRAWLKALH